MSTYRCDILKMDCKVEIIEAENKLRMMGCPKKLKVEDPINSKWSLLFVSYNLLTLLE